MTHTHTQNNRKHVRTHNPTDPRLCVQGMKVSCTHFQCSAGAFSYLRDHFSHNFSVDMSHQILNLNINLMLVGHTCKYTNIHTRTRRKMSHQLVSSSQGQAQECLLEKSMLDNRKSFLVARISAQVNILLLIITYI